MVWSKIFLTHRNEKTSPGSHSVFQKISGREKNFMDKRWGYHAFPSKFLSHCTEFRSLENTLDFQKCFFIEKFHA